MERDYDYESERYFDSLPDPETIGHQAGKRAVARLGSRQIPSAAFPIIFDERIAGSLLSSLMGAISGPAITRGVSFLKDELGKAIFAPNIQVFEDPLLPRGNGSRPWDGEALNVSKRQIIKDGVLQTWLLNMSSARQLGLAPTGHATRGVGSPPGVSSGFKIEHGAKTYPVSEVTIAGNLKSMYKTMVPASDLKMDGTTNAPSLLFEGLTLAGS